MFDYAKRGILNGNIDVVTEAVLGAARGAVEVCFDLVGVMALWYGFAAGGEEYDTSEVPEVKVGEVQNGKCVNVV